MLTSNSIARGRIFWLTDPFKDEVLEDSDDEPSDPHDTYGGVEIGLLGHPVMVLHALEGTTDVAVCVLNTLRGRDLEDRKHRSAKKYDDEFYLAAYPTQPPCPFRYPQLRLMNDVRLRKSGYLCIKKRHIIPLDMLESYNRNLSDSYFQLTPESFAVVANTFAMKIPTPKILTPADTTVMVTDRVYDEPDRSSERPCLAEVKPSAKPQSELECDGKAMISPVILVSLSSPLHRT